MCQNVRKTLLISGEVFSFVIILFSCGHQVGNSQIIEKVYDIKAHTIIAEVDNLGRLYISDDKNNIINFKPDLKEQYRYSNKRNGNVTRIDVTNPLRVIVFYDDFNYVRILDNTLSVITELNLSERFADISACSSSNDGNLWVFDPVQFKLMKINDAGLKLLETSNVNDFGLQGAQITDIKEKGNYVALCDRNKGFYFFDNLGQYLFSFEEKDIRSFQFDGRNVYYTMHNRLFFYSIITKEKSEIILPDDISETDLMYIIFSNEILYLIYKDGVIRKKLK